MLVYYASKDTVCMLFITVIVTDHAVQVNRSSEMVMFYKEEKFRHSLYTCPVVYLYMMNYSWYMLI